METKIHNREEFTELINRAFEEDNITAIKLVKIINPNYLIGAEAYAAIYCGGKRTLEVTRFDITKGNRKVYNIEVVNKSMKYVSSFLYSVKDMNKMFGTRMANVIRKVADNELPL